jgi:hypothetical protein
MLGNELVPVDYLGGEHEAHAGEVKRLGDKPIVVELISEGAKVEVAARPENCTLATGPFTAPV